MIDVETVKSKEIDIVTTVLSESDKSWLDDLRGEDIDNDWIIKANECIDSDGKYSVSESHLLVRYKFYGELLGFNAPTNKLHARYESMKKRTPKLMPIETFIGTQRVLHVNGIDGNKALRYSPALWKLKPSTVEESFSHLQKRGLDIQKSVNKQPSILVLSSQNIDEKMELITSEGFCAAETVNCFPSLVTYDTSRIRRRLKNIRDISKLMKWETDPQLLVSSIPALLGYSDKKLAVHARLFAEHGNAALSAVDVGGMIIAPLEAHIIALANGQPYTAASVRNVQKWVKEPARKARVGELLRSPLKLEQAIGKKSLRAYLKYVQIDQDDL